MKVFTRAPLPVLLVSLLTLFSLLLKTATGVAATTVSSNIGSDTTWTAAGSPYQVTRSITVDPGVVLTVEAGVRVEFSWATALYVAGTLEVFGNAVDRVTFTGSTESLGWWRGIQIYDAGSAFVEYATVSYGGYVDGVNIRKSGSGSLTLDNSVVSYGSNNGLYVVDNSGALSAAGTAFEHNLDGVQLGIGMSSDFIDDSCTFADNDHAVLILGGTVTSDATWDLNAEYSMFLDASVTVEAGATLRVAPGTVVKSDWSEWIHIRGALLAEGTELSPIAFTDERDDSFGGDANGDGDASAPVPGHWRGIFISDGGSADLVYTTVAYGGYVDGINIRKSGSGSLSLIDSVVSHGSNNGLYVVDNSGPLSAVDTAFEHNQDGVQLGIGMSSDFIDDSCTFAGNDHAVLILGGTMTSDTTWDLNAAYSMFLDASVTVEAGATLRVAPGTVVKSDWSEWIHIRGALLAEGTELSPIAFTDERDDSFGGDANGDGDASAPAPGHWRGIFISDGGSADLAYTSVSYGGYVDGVNLSKTGSGNLNLDHASLSYGSGNGLKVFADSGALSATATSFISNYNGVRIGLGTSSDFIADDCSFSGNVRDVAIDGGTMTGDATWDLNGAYSMVLTSNLTVGAGTTLTLAAGTVVKAEWATGLYVDGTLESLGTASGEVYLTDRRDDTVGGDSNNDDPEDPPGPGWWRGVQVGNAGSARLAHTTIRYGGYVDGVNFTKSGSGDLSISDSTFSYSSAHGLRVAANSGALSAAGTAFEHNANGISLGIGTSSGFIGDSCSFAGNVNDVRIEGGTITSDTAWDLNGAYSMFLDWTVSVESGATLRVAPGTVVKSDWAEGIYVHGTLLAEGTELGPVAFTDERDDGVGGDANGDGNASAPEPGHWRGIFVSDSGSAHLAYTTVAYGGYVDGINLRKSGSGSLALDHATISHGSNNGLYVVDNSGPLSAVATAFEHNQDGVQLGIGMSSDFIDDSCTFAGNDHAVLILGGTMTADTVWDLNSAYSLYLYDSLTVAEGATLTVAPGTVVKAGWATGLYVNGSLLTPGTSTEPVYFTDARDDTVGGDANGDGLASQPAADWWRGIIVSGAGSADLDYATIAFGGYVENVNLSKTGSGGLSLDHVTVRDGDYHGLAVWNNSGALSASASRFSGNHNGIWLGVGTSSDFLDAGCSFEDNAHDVALQGGSMVGSATWALKNAYSMSLEGSLTVENGATLTVAPGTVVKPVYGAGIYVKGAIAALGTAGSPVYFTCDRDDAVGGDANGDGDKTVPAPGRWRGIQISDVGSGSFEHATVRYGGYVDRVNLSLAGSGDLFLHNSALTDAYGNGLRVNAATGAFDVAGTLFANNSYNGIHFTAPAPGMALTVCRIESNTGSGIYNDGPNEVDARNNWWGDPSGPFHATANPDGLGDTVSDLVLFEPWRGTPASSGILAPMRSGSILEGDSLRFIGMVSTDPANGYLWDFGDGRTSQLRSPGLLPFRTAGDFDTFLYLVDTLGQLDPSPDSRSLQVVADSGPVPDLQVVSFQVPSDLSIGQLATITYSVDNTGDGPVAGASWEDAVYLSADPYLDLQDQILDAVPRSGDVPPGGTYGGQFQVSIPVVEEGTAYLILSVDDGWAVLERHQLNNEDARESDLGVPVVESGVPVSGSLTPDASRQYFRIEVPEGLNLDVDLDLLDDLGVNEIYLRHGSLPTLSTHDYKVSLPDSADQSIVIPAVAPGTWYILLNATAWDGSGDFSLAVNLAPLTLSGVMPSRHGDSIDAVLTLRGGGFAPGMDVALVAPDGGRYPASDIAIHSVDQITARIAAGAVPPGVYTVEVSRPAGARAELAAAFEMLAGGEATLEANVIVPSQVGYHQLATLFVEYANTGDVAMPAPLLVLSATQNGLEKALMTLDQSRLSKGFWTSAVPEGFAGTVFFLATGDTPGVLQPGETRRVPVYWAGWQQPWDFSYPPIAFDLIAIRANSPYPIDWSSYKDQLRPEAIGDEAWNAVWGNFVASAGPTWGDFMSMLDSSASYLGGLGQRVTDVVPLFEYAIGLSDGFVPLNQVAGSSEKLTVRPGFKLSFERSFPHPISARYELGPLGRGWKHGWQISLVEELDGTVVVVRETGQARAFQPDVRGGYLSRPGDHGMLSALPGGGYSLQEKDGARTFFDADGKLDRFEDTSGNHIRFSYTGDLLTGVSDSDGGTISLWYNADSRIERIADALGDEWMFSYDDSGEHLLAVANPDGTSVKYTYLTGVEAQKEHALSMIEFIDGTHRFFDYDPRGRLSATSRDGGHQTVTFQYGAFGSVAVSTPDKTANLSYGHDGRLLGIQDHLGTAMYAELEKDLYETRLTDSTNRTMSFRYDLKDNLVALTGAAGAVTRLEYGDQSRVRSITDANGNVTGYRYDDRGNPTDILYGDGTVDSFIHDGDGNLLESTTRGGEQVVMSRDSEGRLTRITLPDGPPVEYEYDGRGNIVSTVGAQGLTSYEYDPYDRLIRVELPKGRFIEYAYDVLGRRISTRDQSGWENNYRYDANGYLQDVTDSAGQEIVRYGYDQEGRIARKDKGDGTYTVYDYDIPNLSLTLSNHAADRALLSRFVYAFDSRGTIASMATLDGRWSYGYDAVGQLTRARFESGNPTVEDQDLTYVYDRVGNRVRTLFNGSVTDYVTNGLNQYERIGGADYAYDNDGNLASRTADGEVWSYEYDALNRLVAVKAPGETWSYEYDALGNRVAMVRNGTRTELVFDPLIPNRILAEYGSAGGLMAHYHYGRRLVSRVDPQGNPEYYDYDAMGSIVGISAGQGGYANEYAYRPFGMLLSREESIDNRFLYAGELGVIEDGTGLYHMRARYYDPSAGRFLSPDPLGQLAGVNLYLYVGNNPISATDSLGESDDVSLESAIGAMGDALSSVELLFTTLMDRGLIRATEALEEVNGRGGRQHYAQDLEGGIFEGKGIRQIWNELKGAWARIKLLQTIKSFFSNPRFEGVKWAWNKFIAKGSAALSRGERGAEWLGNELDAGARNAGRWLDKNGRRYAGKIRDWFASMKNQLCDDTATPRASSTHSVLESGQTCSAGVLLDSAVAGARDPNQKIGPAGYADARYVGLGSALAYRIDFENESSASAPAQVVSIVDQLDGNLDWRSFALTEVGFGDRLISVPPSTQQFEHVEGMSYAGTDIEVHISVKLDPQTGAVSALFSSTDPSTGLPPSVDVGFLPPEDGTGRGQGYVAYVIAPRSDLQTGDEVRNVAEITFDFGETIATNQVDPHDPSQGTDPLKEAFNTIDLAPPSSWIVPLPVTSDLEFEVSWSGDDGAGAGVASYSVFVQENGGPFTPWLVDTTDVSANFVGVDGNAYGFYSRATDLLGNQEADKGVAESTTSVDALDTDGDGLPDFYDPDDDNDGIPDRTELDWGLDPLDPGDALLDPDYDGATHLDEYEAGTDPYYPDGDAGLHASSLIYVPVAPCRIVNTLGSTDGSLRPDLARNLLAWGSAAELAAQGGRDDCPHPKQAEGLQPVAVAANVTAVGKQASGNGNIVAYPAGGSDPGASLVNFTTAANIANATVIKLCDPASCDRDGLGDGDFALEANFATVPAIVDVQGYFYPKELQHIVTVSLAGGDYAGPLAALGALQRLVDDGDPARPTAADPYVVLLGPGTYSLGTQPLQLLPGITLRGSGQGVTVLRGLGSADGGRGVVQGADGAVLRELTVEALGDGTGYAIALLNDNASPRLERVTLSAAGATTNLAVLNRNGAQVQLRRVEALATGGGGSIALKNEGSAGALLNRVTLGAGDATGANDALDNGADCTLQARNSLLDGDVRNDDTAAPVLLRASQLTGSLDGVGSFACLGVLDADFAPLDAACQKP